MMSFATATPVYRNELTPETTRIPIIEGNDFFPDIDPNHARIILRLDGTVTDERLSESLKNSIQTVQTELLHGLKNTPINLTSREKALYTRAVFFMTKAELNEQYRDYETTQSGFKKAEQLNTIADDSRRIVRWAISDLLGLTRTTVETL